MSTGGFVNIAPFVVVGPLMLAELKFTTVEFSTLPPLSSYGFVSSTASSSKTSPRLLHDHLTPRYAHATPVTFVTNPQVPKLRQTHDLSYEAACFPLPLPLFSSSSHFCAQLLSSFVSLFLSCLRIRSVDTPLPYVVLHSDDGRSLTQHVASVAISR